MYDQPAFERLEVYRRSYAAALRVHELSLGFPEIERFALADQMRRASRSICANIAEGHNRRRGSSQDFRRYLTMATGSADEMQVWASFARDLSYIDASSADAMRREYAEIARMLHGLAKAWSDGAPAPRL
jgi:four helix bundle protein